jgi:hypothetical protein
MLMIETFCHSLQHDLAKVNVLDVDKDRSAGTVIAPESRDENAGTPAAALGIRICEGLVN